MDWFPLYNSIRIAAISTVIIFFVGIFAAYYIAKTPRLVKGVLDVILTLPLKVPEVPAELQAVGIRMHDIRPGSGKNGFRCRVVGGGNRESLFLHGDAAGQPQRCPHGLGNEQKIMADPSRGGSRNQSTPGSAASSKRQKQ